jgi:methyl-accepting chemotaxis protein
MSKTHFIVFTLSLIILTSAVLAFTIFRLKTVNEDLITLSKKRFTKEARRILKGHVDVVYSLIDFQSKISSITTKKEKELEEYRLKTVINNVVNEELEYRLKTVINIVETTLELKEKWVKKGKMTPKEAQVQAIDEIKKIKYEGGTGYIWINDTTEQPPKLIRHSFFSSDAKDTGNKNASDNQRQPLFKTFVSFTEENGGEGFVKYKWPPKSGEERDVDVVDKVSYVKLFPEWKWIIETGLFLDKAIDEHKKVTSNGMINKIKDELKNVIKTMKYNEDNEDNEDNEEDKGYFWIIDQSDRKYPKYVMHPPKNSSLENKDLTGSLSKYKALVEDIIEVCGFDTAKAIDTEVCKFAQQQDKGQEDKKKALKDIEVCGFDTGRDDEEKGQGYVLPTVQGLFRQEMPKLTYVKCHKQLNWIIGTSSSKKDEEENLKGISDREKFLNKQVNKLAILLSILAATIIFVVMLSHVLINNRWEVLGRQQGVKPHT